MKNGEDIQREYYTKTASMYDLMHAEEVEHDIALQYILYFARMLEIKSILDVGSGTGRAVAFFLKNEPSMKIIGVEPVQDLITRAVQKNKIPKELLICASGERLPFEDDGFNAVCAFGVMHHAKHPNIVVKEMMRVAKKAIFISDSNRFGQGPMAARWLKLILYRIGLWPVVNFIKTMGRGYVFSKGDGIAYSYSVFDSYETLAKWADYIILIPTAQKIDKKSWFNPLLSSSHILICAIKNA